MRRLFVALVVVTGCFAVVPIAAHAAMPGDLDPAFGVGGLTTLVTPYTAPSPVRIVVDATGRIVVVGGGQDGPTGRFVFARLLANGGADPSFGNQGVVDSSTVTPGVTVRGGSVDPSGRVLGIGSNTSNQEWVIARATANGQLDPGFSGGWISRSINGLNGDPRAVIAQSVSGRVIAAGMADGINQFAMLGVNADGSPILDNSWGAAGQNGAVVTDLSPGHQSGIVELFELPDTNLLAVGWATTAGGKSIAIARYLANGQLDTGFANAGSSLIPLNDATAVILGATLDRFGRIDLAITSGPQGAVARVLPSGALDTTFGAGGFAALNVVGGSHLASIANTPDGKILVAGGVGDGAASTAFLIARLNPDGSIDSTFGNGGTVTRPFAGEPTLSAVAVQPDAKVVAGGLAENKLTLVRHLAVGDPPTSRITFPRRSKYHRRHLRKIKGTAGPIPGVAGVEVAIRRLDAKQMKRKHRCIWIKNSRGRVKKGKDRSRKCRSQVWLRAAGTHRWSFSLRRKLPAGKYRIYSRATLTTGATQTDFTKHSGNLKQVKLTK